MFKIFIILLLCYVIIILFYILLFYSKKRIFCYIYTIIPCIFYNITLLYNYSLYNISHIYIDHNHLHLPQRPILAEWDIGLMRDVLLQFRFVPHSCRHRVNVIVNREVVVVNPRVPHMQRDYPLHKPRVQPHTTFTLDGDKSHVDEMTDLLKVSSMFQGHDRLCYWLIDVAGVQPYLEQ